MKRSLLIATAAVLVLQATSASSGLLPNTFDSTATVSKKGHQVDVTARFRCDRSQKARLRVTVTQAGGAVAQKQRNLSCTTEPGSFPLNTEARGRHRFAPGLATACALAVTSDDAKQWCKDVTLVR
jgi:hypothetical protein